MSDLLFQPEYAFLRTAFAVSLFSSVSFGIIGTFVVVRRVGYLAGAISHCAFGGIGIGLYLRYMVASGMVAWIVPKNFAPYIDPIPVAVLVAVACALLIGFVRTYAREREDSVIGAIWAVGMAVGVLALSMAHESANISSYLFGDIFFVSRADVWSVVVLSVIVSLLAILFFKPLAAVCFDEEYAKLRGIPTFLFFQGLLVMTAITVVIMVRVVGILLVIAMLTLPAATAGRFTQRLGGMTIMAIVLCAVASWLGLALSWYFNLPAGPVIVLVSATGYILTFTFKRG